MKCEEALRGPPPPLDSAVVLSDHIVEGLNTTQLAVGGRTFFDGGGERFRIGGVLVEAEGEE
jgi:hypothetical protein